jgi:hypothetical protein
MKGLNQIRSPAQGLCVGVCEKKEYRCPASRIHTYIYTYIQIFGGPKPLRFASNLILSHLICDRPSDGKGWVGGGVWMSGSPVI